MSASSSSEHRLSILLFSDDIATRDAVLTVPALAEELARRGGQLPVLRLPLTAAP